MNSQARGHIYILNRLSLLQSKLNTCSVINVSFGPAKNGIRTQSLFAAPGGYLTRAYLFVFDTKIPTYLLFMCSAIECVHLGHCSLDTCLWFLPHRSSLWMFLSSCWLYQASAHQPSQISTSMHVHFCNITLELMYLIKSSFVTGFKMCGIC